MKKKHKSTSGPNPKDSQPDLAQELIQLHKDKPEFNENYMRRMIMTNFGAGHETLASTLTSIVSLTASHVDAQQCLRDELRNGGDSRAYHQAVIKESKRLRPVIAMSLPRVVPSSGLRTNGYFFPPGTVVGCNPVSLHRNPEICGHDPERFQPERWFDEERAKVMERYSLAWGGGARTCPGRHLAELILDRVVEKLFREFEIEVDIPDEEGESYFLSMRTGVTARFRAVESH